ncbi:MAG: flavin reductase [Gemmatimonadota bacterium]
MSTSPADDLVRLDTGTSIWSRTFTVSPLVVVGTKEEGEGYDLAPKHLAMPLGWENYFGFVCTPRHATYRNARREGAFTVSYPRPTQVVITSLTASGRKGPEGPKPIVDTLDTVPATVVDGLFLRDAYLFLECELYRVVDGFGGEAELVTGRIVAARAHPDAVRVTEGDDGRLIHDAPLLAYLNPGRFASVGQSHPFPFPAGFLR